MQEFKSGFVTLIGRTNVGKSTLLNLLIGEKIAIITSKPQTTRTTIKGIVNRENSQIIFTDTPGIHKPKTRFGENMLELTYESTSDADIILFLIEATSTEIGKGDKLIIEKLKVTNKPTILIINKTDLVKKENLLSLINIYNKEYEFKSIIPISAISNNEREIVLNEIEKILPSGPAYYNKEEYTDQTIKQLVSEIIREKALKLLNDEVPHGIYIEVEKIKSRKTKSDEAILDIEANIFCIRDAHKGIIIGKNGEMIKKIGQYARQDIERMLEKKVNLKLWTKVNKDWQDKNKY